MREITVESASVNLFRATRIPWPARLYRWPFWKWRSPYYQTAFGWPSWVLFRFLQAFSFLLPSGRIEFRTKSGVSEFTFNPANTQFSAVYDREHTDSCYEYATCLVLHHILAGADWFVDGGCNWGYFTFQALANESFKGTVHAFDPGDGIDDIEDILDQLWWFGHRVKRYRAALSYRGGTARLKTGMVSGLARVSYYGIPVTRTCLDNIKELRSGTGVIKVDVEGYELEALCGASAILTQQRPRILFESDVASHPNNAMEVISWLTMIGYRIFAFGVHRGRCMIPDPDYTMKAETVRFIEVTMLNRQMLHHGGNLLAVHSSDPLLQ